MRLCVCECVPETRYVSSPCSLFSRCSVCPRARAVPSHSLSTPLSPHNTGGQRASAAASAAQINQTFSWAEAIAWWAGGGVGWGANMRGRSQRSRPFMSRNTSQRRSECWMRNGQGGCAVIYTPVTSKYTRARGQAPICLVIRVSKTAHSLEDNNAAYLEECGLDLGFPVETFVLS